MNVTDELVAAFASRAPTVTLAVGDVLVRKGDDASAVFVVLTGLLHAIDESTGDDIIVGSIAAGGVAGEVTVIAGGTRTATLRAAEPSEVLTIDRPQFETFLAASPHVADAISAQARERIDRAQVAAMVAGLVGTAETDLVQQITDRVTWTRLAAGDVLFERGDHADAAYFVVSGRVRVVDDEGLPIAELGRGEVVGELGLLDDAPRSATVRAVRDTTLAVFSTNLFEELVTSTPALMLHVARGILTTLRRTPRRKIGRAASLAVAVTAPIDSRSLVDGLTTAIARHGSVRHLSSEVVDRLLNRPGIAQIATDDVGTPRLAEFMHEADVANDHLVLEADRDLTRWTERTLRQSDRAVIVCSATPDDAERAAIRHRLEILDSVPHVARLLALVHPPGTTQPVRTGALLDELGIDDVVHLRHGDAEAVARLGRLATGNGVGLVLGGGGARGFAHLGAYQALVESGVPVDAIGGCSIGAPLGAGLARQLPYDDLDGAVQRLFHRLLDYTVPIVSLVKGARITRSIDETLGGWDIEDLWLPFFCVSTNLTRSRLEVHRRGDVVRAVRASIAIPGVLPPVTMGDDLLVDGGVLNNLPFEPMRDDARIDTVIAVDVAPASGPRAKSDLGLSVSGLRALGASVGRSPSGYPNITSVLLRSMVAGSVYNQREGLASDAVDLHLDVDLPGVSLLDFERVSEVAAAGYEATRDTVSAWARERGWTPA